MSKGLKEEAIDVIRAEGAVFLRVGGERKKFTLENFSELPSEADLALGNPAAESMALENIDAEMERLEAAKKRLVAAKKEQSKAEEPKAEAKAPAAKEEDKK